MKTKKALYWVIGSVAMYAILSYVAATINRQRAERRLQMSFRKSTVSMWLAVLTSPFTVFRLLTDSTYIAE